MNIQFSFTRERGKFLVYLPPSEHRLQEIVNEIAKRALNAIVFSKEARNNILEDNNEIRVEIKRELLNPDLDSSLKMQAICLKENLWDFDYVVVDGVPDYTIYDDNVINDLKNIYDFTIGDNLEEYKPSASSRASANAYRLKLAEAGMHDEDDEDDEDDGIEDLVDDVKNMDGVSLPFVSIPIEEYDPRSSLWEWGLHLLNLENLSEDKIIQIFVKNLTESLTNQQKLIDSFEILIKDNIVHLEIKNLFRTQIESVGRAVQKKLKKLKIIEKWQMLTNENTKINPKDNMTNFQRRIKEDAGEYESDMSDTLLRSRRAETIIKKLLTF